MSMEGNGSLMSRAWNDLVDASTTSISILGPGGIGKTRLMKQLYNKLITSKHFEHVIWITVSSKLTFQKVQSDIARNIGVFDTNWPDKSSEQKSETIRANMSGKKCVVFLDDIWFRIDLTLLGVEGSKFVYSSRSKSMLMGDSGSSAVFTLKELSEADAWELFRHKVGDETLCNLKHMEIARNLVSRCKGLPILISTLGRTMASRRTDKEWKYALRKIKRYCLLKTYQEVIFKFCLDSLPNSMIRWCLLYLSLFPEDFTIHKKELIDFWICEQILVDNNSTDDAVVLGYNAMHTLIEAGLLEEEENDSVKLLDMIRVFALIRIENSWIIFSHYRLVENPVHMFSYFLFTCAFSYALVNNSGPAGWISSMEHFTCNIVPPNLETFLLTHDPFITIKLGPFPGNSCKIVRFVNSRAIRANKLTVLDLSHSGVEEVPREISALVSLHYLNLSYTWIEWLPIELKMLTKLRCLNLEYDDQLRVIPKELISSLLSLRVLKMFRCGFSVEEVESNILSLRNMDINALLSLEHLEVLSITITCITALHKLSNNPKLLNCTQSLSLEVFWGSESLDITRLAVMKNLCTLEIRQAQHLEKFTWHFPDVPGNTSFERLREVNLEKCLNLEELTWIILAQNLAILRVKSCQQIQELVSSRRMGELFEEEENLKAFTKLEILSLDGLPELESIYWRALAFQSLKRIEIISCPLLKKLPLNSSISKADEVVIEAEEEWWTNVEWEDEASKNTFLSCFRPLL